MNATDSQGLCEDGDWLCDLGGDWSDLFDALDFGFDQAATAFQSSTGLSIPDDWLPSTQTLLGSNSYDEAPSQYGSGTISAQNALVGTAMAAGNLPGVGAVFNTALAGYYTYEGEYGTAAAFGGAAIASAVGLPGGSEVADAVDAVGEAGAVAEPAIEAAEADATTTGIAYRAIDPAYADATEESGFYMSGNPGRLGNDGIYANTSPDGAVAEFQYHRPDIDPVVFGVQYPVSPTLYIDPPSGYFNSPLPFTGDANILMAPSLRAPGTFNLLIRNGAVPAGILP